MTTKGNPGFWRYTWDFENRLAVASGRKVQVRYRYDALGRRVAQYAGAKGQTKFTYDGQDVLLDNSDGTLTKYLNGPGIDNKLSQTSSDINYFLSDHLGSTSGLTNASGNLTSQTAYDSFGNQTASLATRFGFTGRERDDITGLIYYRARFYDPNLGRFISEDPTGFAGGGVNLYGYVRNNSTNLIDPIGNDGCTKLPNGKCARDPYKPLGPGEPPRPPYKPIIDPPRPTPTPFAPPPAPPIVPPSTPPTGTTCDCETAIPRWPDFYSGGIYFPIPQTGGAVRIGASFTVDRYGQWYVSPGVSGGYPPGLDASATAGYLLKRCKPSPQELSGYLTGFGGGFSGFSPWTVGGGMGFSSGGGAVNFGIGIPGGSAHGGYGFRFP